MSEKQIIQKPGGNRPEGQVEFAYLDPRSLAIETNVRRDAGLTLEFIESVREHGVLVPILVQRSAEGQLLVRAGQRRTLAAIEAGRETIPARIVNADGDEARRIFEQVVENTARAGLRDADRVAGFEQLSLLGVSAAQIAKKTGHKKAEVATALGVAKSKVATAVQAKYDLDLAQAAVVQEFDDDKEAVLQLTRAAVKEPDQFDHLAQRLRDRRDLAAKKTVVAKALSDAGAREIPAPGFEDKSVQSLADLTDAAGNVLTRESHESCPGHAAYVRRSYNDEAFTAVFVCDAWKANKHKTLRANQSGKPSSAEEAEKARVERARVREGNSKWRSAQTVRRQWLAEFAKRRTAPKNAAAFTATTLLTETRSLEKASTQGWSLAAEWLGATTESGFTDRDRLRDTIAHATPARAQHIALVLTLAAFEARMDEFTWRSPGREARYLTALEGWGYALADIEQTARGEKAAPSKAATAAEPTKGAANPTQTAAPKPTGEVTSIRVKGTDSGATARGVKRAGSTKTTPAAPPNTARTTKSERKRPATIRTRARASAAKPREPKGSASAGKAQPVTA